MLISVIIPTCNRNALLAICLDALKPQVNNGVPFSFEVIVSDDSKSNNARELINNNYRWVTWLNGPKKGPAANRNKAARVAKGEWLVFLDDDCIPQENWMASFLREIINGKVAVLEGLTKNDRPKMSFDEEAPCNIFGDNLLSCNFAIKKAVFTSLEGFDEEFPYAAMEDFDFYERVKRRHEVKFLPDAQVIHPWRKLQPFQNFKKHLKSHKFFAAKHRRHDIAKFRWERAKIFVGCLLEIKMLAKLSMRGWPAYIENCLLNFCLIFV